jgi:hypothetical protein
MFGLVILCESASGNEPTGGLIAHWKLDEDAGITAYDSAGDNDGTLAKGPLWTDGIVDGALQFDGVDNYVDLGNDSSLKPPLPVTFSTWIKFLENGATVISLEDLSSKYCGVWLNVNVSSYVTVAFGDGSGWGDASYRRAKTGTTELIPDTWYHVAGIVRGTTDMSVYINGADDGGTYSGSGGALAYSSGNASIGTGHYENICFNGIIDDVHLYDRALSAEEIQELHRNGLSGLGLPPAHWKTDKGAEDIAHGSADQIQQLRQDRLSGRGLPLSHWKFDEGEGKTAYDSAGDNDGAIYGAQWTTGIIDGALDFDGQGDYVNCGDIDELEFGGKNFSISFWFYTEGVHDGGGGNGKIIAKYNWARGRQWAFSQKRSGSGRIYWYTSPDGTTREDLISQDGGYENEWVHVAAVRDGEIKLLYINGVLDNTGPTDGVVTGKRTSVLIGAIEDSSRQYNFFNGKIDDVRVYNRALSIEEVEQVCGKKPSGHSLPVGPMIVVNNIERAIRKQVEEWKSIDDALRKEWAAYKALEQMLLSGDYGDLSYDAILTARREIHTSIQHGEKSKEELEKSIENLEAALAALGFELVPKASVWLEEAKRETP